MNTETQQKERYKLNLEALAVIGGYPSVEKMMPYFHSDAADQFVRDGGLFEIHSEIEQYYAKEGDEKVYDMRPVNAGGLTLEDFAGEDAVNMVDCGDWKHLIPVEASVLIKVED